MGVAAGHDVAATKTVTDLGCACCFEDEQPFEIPDPPKVTFVDHNPFPSNEDLAKDDIITYGDLNVPPSIGAATGRGRNVNAQSLMDLQKQVSRLAEPWIALFF